MLVNTVASMAADFFPCCSLERSSATVRCIESTVRRSWLTAGLTKLSHAERSWIAQPPGFHGCRVEAKEVVPIRERHGCSTMGQVLLLKVCLRTHLERTKKTGEHFQFGKSQRSQASDYCQRQGPLSN